ncbi:MAG: alpha-L-fucosidase [Bacteroidota bacterium]
MKSNTLLIAIVLILASTSLTAQQKNYLNETASEKEARMEWWNEAKFGMFIHWGPYAVPAGNYRGVETTRKIGEWIMNDLNIPIDEYEKFAYHFNPVRYDAEAWVKMAKDAGMKYIVITSKHHDGFCLWDSKLTTWDIIDASPYNKDLLKQLAEACEKEGIKLCFYHSIMDWHHPNAQAIREPYYNHGRNATIVNPNFDKYIEEYMKPQLKELLTNYGDIGVLWFDGEWIPDYTTEMGKDIYNYLRNLKPDLIINNRVDKGRKGYEGMNREGEFAGDFGTPEQEIPDTGLPGESWEACMTMNDTWGFKKSDNNWKTEEDLIRKLIDIASKGGNFLLNIGPKANGEVPESSVKILKAIGDWMEVNSESIHGTTASPVEQPNWGRYTKKDNTIYAHVFEWPEEGKLSVKGIGKLKKVTMLTKTGGISLEFKGSEIALKGEAPDLVASVLAIEIK